MKKCAHSQLLVTLGLGAGLAAAFAWFCDVFIYWREHVYPFTIIALALGVIALTLFALRSRGERKALALAWKTALSVTVFLVALIGVSGFVNNATRPRVAVAAAVPLAAAQVLVLFLLIRGRKINVLGAAALAAAVAAGVLLIPRLPGCATPLKDLSRLELSNGNRILAEKGLALLAWVPEEGYDPLPAEDLARLGYGPNYYGEGIWSNGEMPHLFNLPQHEAFPDIQWSMVVQPWEMQTVPSYTWEEKDYFGNAQVPSGKEWLSEEQLRYIDTLVNVGFGDERPYSVRLAKRLKLYYEDFRGRHPDVLMYTNQSSNQWSFKEYKEYMKIAEPDLLAFDNYYFSEQGDIPDYKMPAHIADTINFVRIPALLGNDGSARAPIPFGQHPLGFKSGDGWGDSGGYEITESQKNLVSNLTLVMGGKWLNNFIINTHSAFWYNSDGSTTRHFDEYQKLNEEIAALSPHLAKLQTTDVRVVPGKHRRFGLTLPNQRTRTVLRFSAGNDFLLQGISAKNMGQENDGLPGDVYVGYFAVLPGQSFESGKARQYFAVCNGLSSGNGKAVAEQHGSCAETVQEITLDLKPSGVLKLYAVDAGTGDAEEVDIAGGQAKFSLDGGKMKLLFWE